MKKSFCRSVCIKSKTGNCWVLQKRVCLRQDALFTSGLIYVTNKVCFPGKAVNIWQGESQAFSLICFGKSEKWRSLHTLLHPKSRARSKYFKKIAVIIKHATMWWGPRRHGAVHTTLRTEVGGKGTENSRRRIWQHFFWKSLKRKKKKKSKETSIIQHEIPGFLSPWNGASTYVAIRIFVMWYSGFRWTIMLKN